MTEVKPDSETTRLLLGRIRAGERAAFEELFARHRPVLRKLVEFRLDARLRGRVDPSDVVQETQLEAFRQLPGFLQRRPMPFRLWLRKTAQERLRMVERQHLEAARRSVGRELPLPDTSAAAGRQQLARGDPSPSQHIAQGELARRVARCRRPAGRRRPGSAADANLRGAVLRGGGLRPGDRPRRRPQTPWPGFAAACTRS